MPDPQNIPDPISLHVSTYRNALKSTHEISIHSLENSHSLMHSNLHPLARNLDKLDVGALSYAFTRLPECIDQVSKVILGQNENLFCQIDCNIQSWKPVGSLNRRRKMYLDQDGHTLSCFIASISDIDDITTTLTALQIEWNKLHHLLKSKSIEELTTPDELQKLRMSMGSSFTQRLTTIKDQAMSLKLQLLASSWIDYAKTAQSWWEYISKLLNSPSFNLGQEKLYFISSNTYSLLNIVTGQPLKNENLILDFLRLQKPHLYALYENILSGESVLPKSDFLYYCSQFLGPIAAPEPIKIIPPPSYLDITTQIIPVSLLATCPDPFLKINTKLIATSRSYIINIDYPLGFLAYHILNETLENTAQLKGVYIMGKAAILNGQVGDIQVPRVVFDEHTKNSYLFDNCFNHNLPLVNNQGSILTNQKAACVLGTYLQNPQLLQDYTKNNITILEMESGPFLSAVAEASYSERLPKETIIDLNQAPFDVGIINYASDNPYSPSSNLGTQGQMELAGAEPVSLASRAILQRILDLESRS